MSISGNGDGVGGDPGGVSTFGAGATGNKVKGNYIGTDASGTQDLGNSQSGVLLDGTIDTTIGGTEAGARNIISYNGQSGVHVGGAFGTGNRILSNSISDNFGFGIDLGASGGVTANDTNNPDTGPNNLQNFPELFSAKTSGDYTTIKGTLNSTANITFTLQFFGSPTKDASSNNGEGKKLIGQQSVTTDGSGNASFTFKTKKKVPAGQVVSVTTTQLVTPPSSL